jgi:hypothetical protein
MARDPIVKYDESWEKLLLLNLMERSFVTQTRQGDGTQEIGGQAGAAAAG